MEPFFLLFSEAYESVAPGRFYYRELPGKHPAVCISQGPAAVFFALNRLL
jgi:hypothetical protein